MLGFGGREHRPTTAGRPAVPARPRRRLHRHSGRRRAASLRPLGSRRLTGLALGVQRGEGEIEVMLGRLAGVHGQRDNFPEVPFISALLLNNVPHRGGDSFPVSRQGQDPRGRSIPPPRGRAFGGLAGCNAEGTLILAGGRQIGPERSADRFAGDRFRGRGLTGPSRSRPAPDRPYHHRSVSEVTKIVVAHDTHARLRIAGIAEPPFYVGRVLKSWAMLRRSASMRLITRRGAAKMVGFSSHRTGLFGLQVREQRLLVAVAEEFWSTWLPCSPGFCAASVSMSGA